MCALIVAAAQVLFWSSTTASALPIASPSLVTARQVGAPFVSPDFKVKNTNSTQSVARATDGGGQGFSLPAILWLVFCALVGLPLVIAGVRGWKVTSGVGIGLSLAILFYASFINTMGLNGLADNSNSSDLLLDVIVFVAFLVGLGCGWFKLGTNGGPVLLGACGGLALAFMALLLRPGLLFDPFYFANWLLAGFLGLVGAGYTIFRQKFGVIFGSAASGSFLLVLAVDLVINKQSGMSSGLRLLLDRNDFHVAELRKAGYKPALSTIILAVIGIVAIPIISYAQYRFWKEPFSRTEASLREHHIAVHGKPIVAPSELESPVAPGEKPFAPFNVIGTPMRASAAFNSWKPERRKPPLQLPHSVVVQPPSRSRFSFQ